jgi:uncharacterized membrane protein
VSTRLDTAPTPEWTADEFRPPVSRMVVAVLALVGALVSAYLTLYKFGYLGSLQCGAAGGCEVVQGSGYSMLFGLPVAMWGMGAYLILLVVALLGLQPRWADERWVAAGLFGFSAFGVAFSAYLTYLSGAVIGAFCQWCLVSLVTITLVFLFSIPGLRQASRQ